MRASESDQPGHRHDDTAMKLEIQRPSQLGAMAVTGGDYIAMDAAPVGLDLFAL